MLTYSYYDNIKKRESRCSQWAMEGRGEGYFQADANRLFLSTINDGRNNHHNSFEHVVMLGSQSWPCLCS